MVINLRCCFLMLLIFSSFLAHAQNWIDYFDDRMMLNDLRGVNGEECLHAGNTIPGEPEIDLQHPSDLDEVVITINNDSYEAEVASAVDSALERSGFSRIEERIYGLPESSLCFLKMYWIKRTTNTILLVPYFMRYSDRKDKAINQRYIPDEFEKILAEELSMRGLDESVEVIQGFISIGTYLSRDLEGKPVRRSSNQ